MSKNIDNINGGDDDHKNNNNHNNSCNNNDDDKVKRYKILPSLSFALIPALDQQLALLSPPLWIYYHGDDDQDDIIVHCFNSRSLLMPS